MRTLRPLHRPDPRLDGLGDGLRWWRLDADGGRPAAEAVAGAPALGGTWNATVRGERDGLGYALEVIGRPPVGRTTTLRLEGLDAEGAASLVEAAPQAGLTVALQRVDTAPGAVAAVLVERAAGWAAIGVAPEQDPRPVARALGAELDATAAAAALPEPPSPRHSGARTALERPRLLAGALVVAVAAAGTASGAAWWRGRPHSGLPGAAVSAGVVAARDLPTPPGVETVIPSALPPTQPEANFGPSIVYDPPRDEVLVFGGVNGYDQTFVWRPAFHWIAHATNGTAPQGRFGAAAAYDAAVGAVVLFGGRAQNGQLPTDTWFWDGRWQPLGASSTGKSGAPPGGEFNAMAYDPVHQQVVLVTRTSSGGSETWLLGREMIWQLRAGAGPPQPQTMAWDAATQTLVLVAFGTQSAPSQTWTWNGSGWARAADLPVPVLATTCSMATDPQTGHVVLTGNDGIPAADGTLRPRTWVWDGRAWADRGAAPDGVMGLASDVVDHELLAFTQSGGDPSQPIRDTWAWSGASWIQLL